MDSSSSRSTTAEGAAFCRALGALERAAPLRNPDHLARHFVTRRSWRLGLLPLVRALARRDVERRLPGALLLHQARTRIFDQMVLNALFGGASQVVILGAGGDSRPYRLSELKGIRTFEVDHPVTGAWKQARVKRMLGRLPEHVRYLPIDFGTEALAPVLEKGGVDARARTFFLWEGVTMYLPPQAVDDVLSLVSTFRGGSALGFDYLYAEAIAAPDRFDGARTHANFAAARGEPFLFGLPRDGRDLSAFLEARGLTLVTSWDHDALRATCPGDGFFMPFVGIAHAGPSSSFGDPTQGRQTAPRPEASIP